MKKHTMDWKPRRYRRDGEARYCSPSCGHDCTYKEYLIAKRNAAQLAAKLGKAWKPVVHENIGWHFRAELRVPGAGVAAVHRFAQRSFWISVIVSWRQFTATRTTPAKARNAAREIMASHARKIMKVVRAMTD